MHRSEIEKQTLSIQVMFPQMIHPKHSDMGPFVFGKYWYLSFVNIFNEFAQGSRNIMFYSSFRLFQSVIFKSLTPDHEKDST
jgi:hypothetical protein